MKEDIKYNYVEDNVNLIKDILEVLLRNHDSKWIDNNTVSFSHKDVDLGKIELDDKKLSITGEKLNEEYSKLKTVYEDSINNPISKKEYEKTPFEKAIDTNKELGGLNKNRKVFKLLNDEMSRLGISKVYIGDTIKQSDTINNDLQMGLNCQPYDDAKEIDAGYYERLRTFLFDNYELGVEKKTDIIINNYQMFRELPKEKTIDINIDGMLIGKYYSERNFIMIFVNPFTLTSIGVFDEDLSTFWVELIEALTELKLEAKNTDKLREKMFISAFMKKSKDRLKNIDEEVKSYTRNIEDYERNITNFFLDMNSRLQEKQYIEKMIEANGVGIFSEIERIKELSFVKDVNVSSENVIITFIPTVVPIPNLKRDLDKGFGKRYAYVGSITFTVSPGGFSLDSDARMKNESGGHTHPHGSSGSISNPCMGDGDGKRKVYELLSCNKFYDLAKMLWFWIKTYREEGAYVKGRAYYDDRLQCGFPVFDEKMNRIEINDKERIESGEQIKLTKLPCYKDNFDKFKDWKMEE